jgi:hypothetical protein
MKFSLFKPPMDRHLLKSREYLEEAKIKRVEHQAAAEHHGALTQLYAERISRIEAEISKSLQEGSRKSNSPLPAADSQSVHPQSDSVLVYAPRALHNT